MKYQSIHANQIIKNGTKSHWELKCDDNTVIKLTPYIKDIDIFNFMGLIKSIEVEAYNEGINFQKDKQNRLFERRIKELLTENERLAAVLEKHIKGSA